MLIQKGQGKQGSKGDLTAVGGGSWVGGLMISTTPMTPVVLVLMDVAVADNKDWY